MNILSSCKILLHYLSHQSDFSFSVQDFELSEGCMNCLLKYQLINDPSANVKDLFKKEQYVLSDQKKNAEVNCCLIKNLPIESILDTVYQLLFLHAKDSEDKKQLEQFLMNAKTSIKQKQQDKDIDNRQLKILAQLLRGERFIFSEHGTFTFAVELLQNPTSKVKIPHTKQGDWFFRFHIFK